MNLAALVRQHAARHADRPAIRFHDDVWDYAALADVIERIAAFVHGSGAAPGDRIGLSMAEHPLHLAAHFGLARLGAVIVPMDHRWTDAEKTATADAFGVTLVLTDSEPVPGVRSAALDAAALDVPTDDLPGLDDDPGDLLISLSSGTTGRPTGAVLTHENLYQRFVSQWQVIGYGADDCFAILTPFYFGAGRSFGMSLLAAGGTVRIAPPPLPPAEIVEVLSRDDVTATFLPPTLLRRLSGLYEAGGPPLLENIRYMVVSGEPLHADEARRFRQAICPNLYCYYASSEGGGISVLTPDEVEAYAATVGRPTWKTEVQIVDGDGNEVEAGVVGRLRYRGPGVSTRLVDEHGEVGESDPAGWFYPGDLAEMQQSGHIMLRGRDKDVIIRGGVNVYPAEIEAVLLAIPDISEAAAVGIEDPERGQIVAAFVVAAREIDTEAIERWCRERLAPYKVPQQIVTVESMPRKASGKIDKQALTARGDAERR